MGPGAWDQLVDVCTKELHSEPRLHLVDTANIHECVQAEVDVLRRLPYQQLAQAFAGHPATLLQGLAQGMLMQYQAKPLPTVAAQQRPSPQPQNVETTSITTRPAILPLKRPSSQDPPAAPSEPSDCTTPRQLVDLRSPTGQLSEPKSQAHVLSHLSYHTKPPAKPLIPGGPCENPFCGLTEAPQWRRIEKKLVCNRCGMYYHRHARFPDWAYFNGLASKQATRQVGAPPGNLPEESPPPNTASPPPQGQSPPPAQSTPQQPSPAPATAPAAAPATDPEAESCGGSSAAISAASNLLDALRQLGSQMDQDRIQEVLTKQVPHLGGDALRQVQALLGERVLLQQQEQLLAQQRAQQEQEQQQPGPSHRGTRSLPRQRSSPGSSTSDSTFAPVAGSAATASAGAPTVVSRGGGYGEGGVDADAEQRVREGGGGGGGPTPMECAVDQVLPQQQKRLQQHNQQWAGAASAPSGAQGLEPGPSYVARGAGREDASSAGFTRTRGARPPPQLRDDDPWDGRRGAGGREAGLPLVKAEAPSAALNEVGPQQRAKEEVGEYRPGPSSRRRVQAEEVGVREGPEQPAAKRARLTQQRAPVAQLYGDEDAALVLLHQAAQQQRLQAQQLRQLQQPERPQEQQEQQQRRRAQQEQDAWSQLNDSGAAGQQALLLPPVLAAMLQQGRVRRAVAAAAAEREQLQAQGLHSGQQRLAYQWAVQQQQQRHQQRQQQRQTVLEEACMSQQQHHHQQQLQRTHSNAANRSGPSLMETIAAAAALQQRQQQQQHVAHREERTEQQHHSQQRAQAQPQQQQHQQQQHQQQQVRPRSSADGCGAMYGSQSTAGGYSAAARSGGGGGGCEGQLMRDLQHRARLVQQQQHEQQQHEQQQQQLQRAAQRRSSATGYPATHCPLRGTADAEARQAPGAAPLPRGSALPGNQPYDVQIAQLLPYKIASSIATSHGAGAAAAEAGVAGPGSHNAYVDNILGMLLARGGGGGGRVQASHLVSVSGAGTGYPSGGLTRPASGTAAGLGLLPVLDLGKPSTALAF